MSETPNTNAGVRSVTVQDPLHDVRFHARLYVRLALAALYGLLAGPLFGLYETIPFMSLLAYLLLAPLAFFRCRRWWMLEPGPESLYWYVLGCAEIIPLFLAIVAGIFLSTA